MEKVYHFFVLLSILLWNLFLFKNFLEIFKVTVQIPMSFGLAQWLPPVYFAFPRSHTEDGCALGVGLRNSSLPRAFALKGKRGQK